MLNEDYKDILHALLEEKVKFLLVGAYAMAVHGYVRSTMDIDLWVEPSPENAEAVLRALQKFGAPLENLTQEDLLNEETVFQIGVAPCRIDILTGLSGVVFSEVYEKSQVMMINGLEVRIIGLDDLIRNKRASNRLQDLADVKALESLKNAY